MMHTSQPPIPEQNNHQDAYAVVTFAYNEENTIGATLDSIIRNSDERLKQLTVIANGCSDNTVAAATQATAKHPNINCRIIELSLGDKCNAWNEYVYNHLPDVSVHFFVDSDVTFTDNAFPLLFEQLQNSDRTAVTGLPQSGRNLHTYVELATRYSCLFGNLYGLKHGFLERLRQQNIRLPIGLSWIDAQITKLVNDDLAPKKDDYQHRVTFLPGVGYQFDSLKPWRKADIQLYINRITRYKTGQLQEPYLDALPFTEWPYNMNAINQQILSQGIPFLALGKLMPLRHKIIKRLKKQHSKPAMDSQ